MDGFPLKLGGVACMGALSCGPVVDDPTVSGSGDGTSGTGFDGPTMASHSEGPPDSTATGTDPGACSNPGGACGEFLVCQCNCDYTSDCCYCEDAVCTEDAHCAVGQACVDVQADPYSNYIEMACIPGACGSFVRSADVNTLREALGYQGDVCLSRLSIDESGLADLTAFSSLEYVHGELLVEGNAALVGLDGLESLKSVGTLSVADNPVLTSVTGLGGLQEIRVGGAVRNNPALPAADVHALLAGIEGGDAVQVCGNLDDVGC